MFAKTPLSIINNKDPSLTDLNAYDVARDLSKIGLHRDITKDQRVLDFLITGLNSSQYVLKGLYAVPLVRSASEEAYIALDQAFEIDKDVKDCNPFGAPDGLKVTMSKIIEGIRGSTTADLWRIYEVTIFNPHQNVEERINAASQLLLYSNDMLNKTPAGNVIASKLVRASFQSDVPLEVRKRAQLVYLFIKDHEEVEEKSLSKTSFSWLRS